MPKTAGAIPKPPAAALLGLLGINGPTAANVPAPKQDSSPAEPILVSDDEVEQDSGDPFLSKQRKLDCLKVLQEACENVSTCRQANELG